ncbi:MAG TPA: hypothetical protein VLJ10_05125 [Candidatus Bathyarchaeia archaeon]|nr:hypothetical protein [Candidatus Bathyarchaeia archaeon]
MEFDRNRVCGQKQNQVRFYLRKFGLEDVRPVLKTTRFKNRRFVFK